MKHNISNTQNAEQLIIGLHCGRQGRPASLACADKLFVFVQGHPSTQPPDGQSGTNCLSAAGSRLLWSEAQWVSASRAAARTLWNGSK